MIGLLHSGGVQAEAHHLSLVRFETLAKAPRSSELHLGSC